MQHMFGDPAGKDKRYSTQNDTQALPSDFIFSESSVAMGAAGLFGPGATITPKPSESVLGNLKTEF
jgi:hypothetical protein